MTGTIALEATFTTPVTSFRNPLYAGVQVTLPCPPPATVGGLLAAAAGGWDQVDTGLRFAMAFHAGGRGVDYETYHPLDASGKKASPTPRNREFLAATVLTVWLLDDVEQWWRRLRRPVWPLRLGRSQDLVGISLQRVPLTSAPGVLGSAIVPGDAAITGGTPLRLPTAIAPGRDRTRWGTYRFDATGRSQARVPDSASTPDGRAVMLLPGCHPDAAAWR
ncbi:CRISPR-associated protein Cas5 [Actinoallomurus rhizosphaericola]|uniref:CRISPR-associated protein Cas5 n=1 Tax=Actinoallomurus rhizosphaericola TaxID=2952536 RepID=UPI002093B1B9|nr:CRISPR-associated protein Cas5 [Actinoallomurus rhizosphaericola]MCO5996664.1 CRISPR-associated protein Cas5 [Actinoallomurus rhizosphaericola]